MRKHVLFLDEIIFTEFLYSSLQIYYRLPLNVEVQIKKSLDVIWHKKIQNVVHGTRTENVSKSSTNEAMFKVVYIFHLL